MALNETMNVVTHFRVQAFNNAWANHRLLKACAQLTADELKQRRTNFFPSIIETYNHILTVDWFYVSALEGASIGYEAFKEDIPCPEFDDLNSAQHDVDKRLINAVSVMSELDLCATTTIFRGEKSPQIERTDRVLHHLLQHQIHHRGQIHAMLSGTAVKPPQLDEFYFDPFHDDFHHEDFVELGFDRQMIWGDA